MKHRWLWAWLLQIAIMLIASLAASLLSPVHPVLSGILLWAVVPLAGLLTACRTVRRGLNNYLAWIAPPACLFAVHYALWRYSPSAGAAILTAFTSLVGAAAGDVLNRRELK